MSKIFDLESQLSNVPLEDILRVAIKKAVRFGNKDLAILLNATLKSIQLNMTHELVTNFNETIKRLAVYMEIKNG